MLDNIKAIKLELDSIKFIKKQKESGEYDRLREMDKQNPKKMEVLTIKSVLFYKIASRVAKYGHE
jgi:hypothetical protein